MGDLTTVALVALTSWMVVISAVMALFVRQVAVVSRWVGELADGEGLEVGAKVPERVLLLLPDLAHGLNYLAIIDGNSQQGQEFALEAGRSGDLAELRSDAAVTVAVLGGGPRPDSASGLLPAWFRIARDHVADVVKFNFKVRQTPAVYEIEEGRVTGKAGSGYGVINFVNLVAARSHSDAAEFAGRSEGPEGP